MRLRAFDPLLDAPFQLRARPEPLEGDLRLSWGIALLILLLGSSRGKRASYPKLHLLAHHARTAAGRREMVKYIEDRDTGTAPLVRFEPWLNKALSFAAAEGLIVVLGGKGVGLTARGNHLLAELRKVESPLEQQRLFAERCAKRLTEGDVNILLRTGKRDDV